MWIEHPILQLVGGILVALFVLARMFPQQRWLESFRLQRHFRRPRPPLEDYLSQKPTTDSWSAASQQLPVQVPTPRMAARHRSVRRFQRSEAGVSIIILGVVIPFGVAAIAMMTGNDPYAEGRVMLARVLAGICIVAGVLVLFAPDRRG